MMLAQIISERQMSDRLFTSRNNACTGWVKSGTENRKFRAISLWNTVYMERAVDALKRKGVKINEQLLAHLSPLGWEHINMTGDYIWKNNWIPAYGKFRRLRPVKVERSKNSLNVQ